MKTATAMKRVIRMDPTTWQDVREAVSRVPRLHAIVSDATLETPAEFERVAQAHHRAYEAVRRIGAEAEPREPALASYHRGRLAAAREIMRYLRVRRDGAL